MISSVINKIDPNQNQQPNAINDQLNFSSISFPDELIFKILSELPPFKCLALSTLSKKVTTLLDNDLFWKEKLVNIVKNPYNLDFPLRSLFIIEALAELNILRTEHNFKEAFIKFDNYKPSFLNQPEMLSKVLESCRHSEKDLNEIFSYVDKNLLNDTNFILDILPSSDEALKYASNAIKKDPRFNILKHWLHIDTYKCESTLGIGFKRANPAQRALFIKQLTQNILEK